MQIFVSLSLNVVLLFLLSIKYMLNDSKSAMFVVLKAEENDLIFYLLALQSFHLPKLTFLFFSQLFILSRFITPKMFNVFPFIRAAFALLSSLHVTNN